MLAMTSSVRMDSGPMLKQKAYQTMYEHMGMGDHVAITNIMVTKVSETTATKQARQEGSHASAGMPGPVHSCSTLLRLMDPLPCMSCCCLSSIITRWATTSSSGARTRR